MAVVNVHRVEHTRYVRNLPVKANAVIKRGEIIMSQDADGFCLTCTGQANCKGIGIAIEDVDATGLASGAETVDVEQGIFLLDNHGTNTCTTADVAKKTAIAYGEDYKTVGNVPGALSPVGIIVGLNWDGVAGQSPAGVQVRIES